MLLSDATSREQVEAALAAGDEELRDDIATLIVFALGSIKRRGLDYETEEYSVEDIVKENEDFLSEIVKQSDPDVSHVPIEKVQEAVGDQARYGRRGEAGIFTTKEDSGWRRAGYGFEWTFTPNYDVWLSESHLFENCEMVPAEYAKEFYADLDRINVIEWSDGTDIIQQQNGWQEGHETVSIVAKEDDFKEFCHDIIKDHLRDLIKRDPDEAIAGFVRAVREENPSIAAKLAATPPAKDDLIELTTSWSQADDEDEREEVIQKVRDYYEAIEGGGSSEQREEIATFSADELRQMGVTKGVLIEQAPWRLIKLRSSDLRAEGTRMKHCVGDKGMGYIKAVVDGYIEIWSFRDRDDKPRFTLEVDSSFYEAEDPDDKADAIKQIKGSTNRTPGYASKHDSGPNFKFPEEVAFWKQVFTDIGVNPTSVNDFDAARELAKNSRRRFTPNRSFDEPYEPLSHR